MESRPANTADVRSVLMNPSSPVPGSGRPRCVDVVADTEHANDETDPRPDERGRKFRHSQLVRADHYECAHQGRNRVQAAGQHDRDLTYQDVPQRPTADPGDRTEDDRLAETHV